MNNSTKINDKDLLDTAINSKPIDTINYDVTQSNYDVNQTSNDILKAAETGFIDGLVNSNLALRPKLLINDYSKGSKVLSDIISELSKCDEFMISVAFITSSGITPLLETLKTLKANGIKGKILTTDYLNFSEPKALKKLLDFSNLSIKVYSKDNFHTKGYIFRQKDHYKLIVGSSNLTQTALTKNKEWNMKVSSIEEGSLTEEVLNEFKAMWAEADDLTLDWLKTYEDIYLKQREFTRKSTVPRIAQYKLQPNKMQVSAIQALNNIRENGTSKALLISATGTGKTYLSAFDVRNFKPGKALFIVHREQIAKQAMNSFKNVFGDTIEMGILSGNSKNINTAFLFSTIQTLSKDEVLYSFGKTEFDYIIIDEVHRAGATTYQKIVSYFEPKFLLGMTATPERTDDFDIFKMFDHNIAYEIRLQQDLEEDLLCPFHYFGITDISVNGHPLDDNTDFSFLVTDERVNHIINKINFYGYSGDKVKGLIFCSNKNEAAKLSYKFNQCGFRTLALTGDNSQEERDIAISRLEQDESSDCLDYIFTVDIFNEGVDIPAVNQVVMLRPTKSAIIFIQQLGRGLRKFNYKEYVVIIDFVGNYNNNFLIPIALSGDRTYNKDNIRKYVLEGNRIIPGCSTVNFDEISKKRIFESIDNANFSAVKLIRENYNNLKQKLGRIPKLRDFDLYESIDPIRIFDNNSLGSYHKFLTKYEDEYNVKLTPIQEEFIEFISKKLAAGKRIHELELIKCAIEYKFDLISNLKLILTNEYNIEFTTNTETSIVNVLTNEFASGTGKATYKSCIFLERYSSDYKISQIFLENLNCLEFKEMVLELINFGIDRYKRFYSNRYMNTSFQLYQKYTYEDVCRLLEWERNEVATNIGGYKFNKETKTYPVFINYNKSEDISDTIKYEDRFKSSSELIGLSKQPRKVTSPDVVQMYNAEKDGVEMSLFIRKNKDDKISNEFYFLGKIKTIGNPKPVIMKDTDKPAVEIIYQLHTPVREDLYDYFIS